MPGHLKCGECLVLGDSIIWNVETECSYMKVECFLGNRMEQLHGVIEYRDPGSSDTVIDCVGTNDLRITGNLNYVMGRSSYVKSFWTSEVDFFIVYSIFPFIVKGMTIIIDLLLVKLYCRQ